MRCHGTTHRVGKFGTDALCNQTSESVSNGNGPNSCILLIQGYQNDPKEDMPGRKGRSACSTRLTKAVRHRRSLTPAPSAEGLVRSFKCWGRRPSGLPADPLGKEWIDLATPFSDTTTQAESSCGGGGLHESG